MTGDTTDYYEVRLEVFEGPLDLLLHLIRKNEVDIFDIPIAAITDQYLEYLDMMKALNISVAGDFLVMAATLIHIKSKMLLPPSPGDEDKEEEDPRLEIARPLLEYMRLKEAAGELAERDILDRDVFRRPPSPPQPEDTSSAGAKDLEVNLFQLMDAFKRVVEQRNPGASISFRTQEWSLKEKMTHIMERLKKGSAYFGELFAAEARVDELVATFLALLELVQAGMILVYQPEIEKDILLEPLFDSPEEEGRA
ncbi:MAG: segregation and condensation protein A [Desulfobacteraceae bacterium]